MNWDILYKSVATLLATLVTGFLLPWLKAKSSDRRFVTMKRMVETAVTAAEQIYTRPQSGELKKEFVLEQLQKWGWQTDATMEHLLEAAVYALNQRDCY